MKKIVVVFLFLAVTISVLAGRPLKVLAIGNSFSEDATEQYLSSMALMGGHDLIIGNLYYPGCSINKHLDHLLTDKKAYSYRKMYVGGHADTIQHCTLTIALTDEDWDIITFQQASMDSGVWSTYRKLPQLMKKVRSIVGPHPEFYWHQTWAYAPDSKQPGYNRYSKNQMKMFNAIINCTKKVLKNNPELKGLIPTGTAIQDARTSELGDNLTRDGFHLDKKTGRYIAACTWYGALFHRPFTITTFLPSGMTVEEGAICREAAEAALSLPFQVVSLSPVPEPEPVDD